MSLRFETGAETNKGARPRQEDAFTLWPCEGSDDSSAPGLTGQDLLIAALADGMGGHAGGALASRTVCTNFLEGFARDASDIRNRLRAGLVAANRAVELQVEPGDAESVLMRWRLDDGSTRVIYGDLSADTEPAEQ